MRSCLFVLFFLLAVGFGFRASAQGSIAGTVKDAATGEPVIGANVMLQGTQTGTSTDIDGKFLISSVPAGTYNLQVSYITYKTHLVENVKVENGKRITIEVQLTEDVSELNEVVVRGTRSVDTDFTLLAAIRESKLVVSGISAEMISRSPDRDAAEVVKRVPGVTIMGGRYIVIRGASDRYNVTLLNGAYAPSMEADRRAFAFDVIPSGQIDQMLIFKSPAPELPGDFAGGVVKITTKSIPDETGLTFGYTLGYRSGSTFKTFYQSDRNLVQNFGFNGGTYDLPAVFPADLRGVTDEQMLRNAALSLKNDWLPKTVNSFFDQGASLTGNFKFRLGNIEVGNITALTWSNSRNRFSVQRKDFNQYDFISNSPSAIYAYTDDQNNQNSRTGILMNWAFRFNENHVVEFRNIYNQINNSQYIYREGQNFEGNFYGTWGGFQEIFRGVYAGQLTGKHKLFADRTTINWMAGMGKSYRDLPDNRRYRRDRDLTNGTERTYVPVSAAQVYFLGRFYGNMDEDSFTGSVSIDHTLKLSENLLPVVSAGIFFEKKERRFLARNIGYARNAFGWDTNLEYLPVDELFQPDNIYRPDGSGLIIDEQTNGSDSYSATNNLKAYYTSVSLPLGKVLTLSGGARIEDNVQSLGTATRTGDAIDQSVPVKRILPSANLTVNLKENMLVRAVYGRTLNRPEFREIAPFSFYDFEFNWVYGGNPGLKTAKIDNYDLRWEYYPSKTELITFGGFYKSFENAIEAVYVPGAGSQGAKGFRYDNARSASVYGVELEVRKSLSGLTNSPFVDNLNVIFNTTLSRSTVDVGNQPERPLMGQSPYVVNAGLFYNTENAGTQVSVMYNVVGRRLFAVGGYTDAGDAVFEDIYEMPRNLIDVSVTQRFTQRLQGKLTVSDILNQPYILMQDGNRDGVFDRNNDQIVQKNRFGSLFMMTLTYKIW
ncbi:MAG: collagen-binding protein [Cyclobacteriaceae bacterium]|nr:MAG: collagen-binding protein [Cyclobacteriaceae bacterium]